MRSRLKASFLFSCCDRDSYACATTPVGLCVMRMADSVLLRCCPPGPLARIRSTYRPQCRGRYRH
eukprot:scaffold49_cov409-Prasinococcus_capsulatus_cf.AAC.34